MASLTPGTLSTLLNTTTPSKPTSNHRSSLLQIIAIVPSFNTNNDNTTTINIYHNKGFYIRVSDSLHSAYVSVCEKDVDLILSDKIQLGQFVYVQGFDVGFPVPVVRGLKVVPKRRECVGNPIDLISSDVLIVGKKEKKRGLRRVSLGNVKGGDSGVEMRRLSLDSSRKGWDKSLVGKYGGGSSDSAASVHASKRALSEKNSTLKHPSFSPLKQVLPHRKSLSEKDLTIKPPSPRISPLKQVVAHRKSLSERDLAVKPPSPRISPLKQVLPITKSLSDKDSTFRPPSPRISPLQHGLSNKNSATERDSASKHSSSNISQFKHVPASISQMPEKKSTLKPLNLGVPPLQNKNAIDSPSPVSKPIRKDLKQSTDGTNLSHLFKVPLSLKTWSDAKISWSSLSSNVHDLGKEVMSHRNARFMAAVYALQETSAAENVLQCMRMFAELCESSEKESSLPLVEDFLNLHQNMQKVATVTNTLLSVRLHEENGACNSLQCSFSETYKNFVDKNALSWVQAAVETNLSKFNMFTKEDKRGDFNGEKCHYVVLEHTPTKVDVENHSPDKKQSPRNQQAAVSSSSLKTSSSYHSKQRLSTTKKATTESEMWSKGNGLTEAASLAEKLLLASQAWFLDYLDASLKKGFGFERGERDSEIACLLGQLKRVNQWLDDSVTNGSGTDERIEGLKKKIYGFLLDNVNSAVMQTGN